MEINKSGWCYWKCYKLNKSNYQEHSVLVAAMQYFWNMLICLFLQPRICTVARELSWVNYLHLGREFLTALFCNFSSNFNAWYSRTSFMQMLLLARYCSVFTLSSINDPTALIRVFAYSLAYGSLFCWRLEKVITCTFFFFFFLGWNIPMFSDFLSGAKMLLEHIP